MKIRINFIKKYLMVYCMIYVTSMQFIIAAPVHNTPEQPRSATQQTFQPAASNKEALKSNFKQSKTPVGKGKATSHAPAQLEPHLDQKLITKLTKAVDAIPAKYEKSTSNDKSKTTTKTVNKQYKQKVEEAYEAYKELYDYAIHQKQYTTSSENETIRKSVKKLFDCKNIQNMPWGRK